MNETHYARTFFSFFLFTYSQLQKYQQYFGWKQYFGYICERIKQKIYQKVLFYLKTYDDIQ